MSSDLTITDVINDPLIVQLLHADKVSMAAFTQLLHSAARVQLAQIEQARRDSAPIELIAGRASVNSLGAA